MKGLTFSMLSAALALGTSALPTTALANDMVVQTGNVVVGYWHNWCDGAGYKGGVAPCVDLTAVHPHYNVVDVSFMKVYNTAEGRIPTFRLDPAIGLTEAEFIDQIATLNSQGRSVLLALGGADAHIELQAGDEQAFADEIIRLTDKFGFDGLDIDLEQTAITAAANQTVIPAALKIVKDHYQAQGKHFMITMAPEFPYLSIANGKYLPYIQALNGYYDFINPQFYNQGGDGVYVDGVGWLSQNSPQKQQFIYYMADSLINGTRGYTTIPHDKLVFGIPANIDGAANGFIENPNALYGAFEQLSQQGQPLRGVMTWSVNWDMGKNAAGQPYHEQFIKDYGSFIHNQQPPLPDLSPIFTGLTDVRVLRGEVFEPLIGVVAKDSNGADISSNILVEGQVNTSISGEYVLTYKVSDNQGNSTSEPRKVTVYDLQPVFDGVSDVRIPLNSTFDPMAGVTVTHPVDGDLTSQTTVSGQVDTGQTGTYALTYTVVYGNGDSLSITRNVEVFDDSQPGCSNAWNSNTIYVADDRAIHNGQLWRAKWWTRGEEPGTTGQWGVWESLGAAGCQ